MQWKIKIPRKKGILAAASLLGALGIGLGTAAGSWEREPASATVSAYTQQAEPVEWEVLLYMVGSNLESETGAATTNLRELLESDLGTVRVVGQAGGCTDWETEAFADGMTTRFLIEDGILTVQETMDGCNMGEASTLADFLAYARTGYPAEKTVLVLWDHGDGPVGGFGCDDLYGGDSLTLTELEAALSAAGCGETPLEVIGLDACCMASLEVALALAPYGQYMVASQELEPAAGWDYTVAGRLAGLSGAEAARLLAQGYYDKNSPGAPEATVSVTDLSQVAGLAAWVEEWAEALGKCDLATLMPFRGTVYGFGAAGRSGGASDLVDLQALAKALQPLAGASASLESFTQELQEAVLLSCSQDGQACGLSLYAPYAELEEAARKLSAYRSLDVLPDYEELAFTIADYLLQVQTQAEANLPLQSSGEEFVAQDPGNVKQVYLTLWERDENQTDYYYLVGTDSDVELEGGWYTADIANEWTFLDGQPLCTVELESPSGLYTRFACPVLYEGQRANLILQYDAQFPYGRVVCLVPLEEDHFSRQRILLQGGESITPLYPVEAFTETADQEVEGYLTQEEGFKVGQTIHYTAGMEPEALPASQDGLYGFWFITWENQDVYSEFLAAS